MIYLKLMNKFWGLAVAVGLATGPAAAGNVKVNWQHDQTSCADGSAPTNCPTTGFEISEGTTPQTLLVKGELEPTARTVTYQNIAAGQQRCYQLVAFSGPLKIRSVASNVACTTVPYLPAKAPQIISVTVTITVEPPSP